MLIRPVGERALLVEVDTLDAVIVLGAALAASRPVGVEDIVPAACTVLVSYDPARIGESGVRSWIDEAAGAEEARDAAKRPRLVEVPVRYDGVDVESTAALLGVTSDALVAAHLTAEWTVAFTGFAPGFGYLISADWPFDVPRLDAPRTRVPAGSVGLAGGFSGAYPRETPGGWRLIATTDAPLFDPTSADPVLLPPGARVRFVRAVDAAKAADADAAGAADPPPAGSAEPAGGIRVLAPGLAATVQDLGRPGRASLGIARSGALDRRALRLANRLVGNAEDAAGIEVVLGGFRGVALADAWIALVGASGPVLLDGRPIDRGVAVRWPAGAELFLDWFDHGARTYLAVRGGIETTVEAGSRSTDTLAGLGPSPLAAGVVLPVGGGAPHPIPAVDAVAPALRAAVVEVELAPGPRADWFGPAARRALFDADWRVTADADRVGMRLDGPMLERTTTDELPSEGMRPGALQVPPSGRPTILLADGPVTGGYPVIAVATDAAMDRLGQARPGTILRFRRAGRRGG